MSSSSSWITEDFEESPVLRKRKPRDDGDMDITPMIDITFLLLIFFLVCSTPDQQGSVDLPPARHGKGVGEQDSVIVTISDEGINSAPVYLADGKIESERLPDDPDEQRLALQAAVDRGRREEGKENVLIKADRNVAHRDVARVIKAVSQVEGTKIHLAVLEED
ncbi:MAG: biopolymer transporter ExbD [Planctomycetes bacterium]|nr:biopolymer transporter ExbD [Planctomycetota bacterium]